MGITSLSGSYLYCPKWLIRKWGTMKKRILLFIWVLVGTTAGYAQTSSYQAYVDSMRKAQQAFNDENNKEAAVAATLAEYEAYEARVLAEFENFKQDMLMKWGDYKDRTKTKWVEYIDGGDARAEVDFEENEVTIEILVEDPEDVEEALEELPEVIEEVVENKGTEMGFESEEAGDEPVLDEPVLEEQLDKKPEETNKEYVERVVEENNVEVKTVVGEDGEERVLLSINFGLAPESIQTRAEKVQNFVYEYAKEYSIVPSLVFAIIHTESYFNPMASSPANAFGLMQLVPTSGGADAYRRVHKSEGYPTKEFLFEPGNNVQLGCAYVDILMNRYLTGISNDLTKSYLAISAYNTGTGNVYKAYDSSGSKSKANAKIESMTPQENYDWLVTNLPYEETRDYLKKVVDRSKMYEGWAEN